MINPKQIHKRIWVIVRMKLKVENVREAEWEMVRILKAIV